MSGQNPTSAIMGKEILPHELGYLPEFFREKGERELCYTQSVREKTLREFKEAIAGDNTIKSAPFTDECLLVFLTCKKYEVPRALEKLKKCIEFQRKNERMFNLPSFEALSVYMTSELYTVLPWRDPDGSTLVLVQTDKYNSAIHSFDGMSQYFNLLLFQSLREPMTQVNGFSLILDLNMTFETLKVCTPENLYLLYYCSQIVLPGRFKNIHMVNLGVTGRIVYGIAKIFVSKKVKERMELHVTNSTLLDFFPKAVLPTKYGGDLKDHDMTEWLRKATSAEELKWLRNFY